MRVVMAVLMPMARVCGALLWKSCTHCDHTQIRVDRLSAVFGGDPMLKIIHKTLYLPEEISALAVNTSLEISLMLL